MRITFCVAMLFAMGGCGGTDSAPISNQHASSQSSAEPISPPSELSKSLEAARLFIEVGQPDQAKLILQEAAVSAHASSADKALIGALLAKANAASKPSADSMQGESSTGASSSALPESNTSAFFEQSHRELPLVSSSVEVSNKSESGKENLASENPPNPSTGGGTFNPSMRANDSRSSPKQASLSGALPNTSLTHLSDDLPAIIEKVQPSVVKITTSDSIGSGFVIEDGLVVTNRHVMEGATKATVQFKDGRTHKVEGIVFDGKKLDLCILRCEGLNESNSKPLEFCPIALRQGEGLFTFGAPQGLEFSVSEGIVSANRWIDEIAYVQTTAPISSGNSGGPLLSTKDGTLVGINTWTRVDGQNLNFAIASSELKDALKELLNTPMPLNLTEDGNHALLATEAGAATFAEQMKAMWEEKVESRRKVLQPRLDKARASLNAATTEASKTAYAVKLEQVVYEYKTVATGIQLDVPKIHLRAHLGKIDLNTYGFVQDAMPVLQILNEWNCLLYLDGIVFLLEDFPTESITTDTVLTAKDGPVIYVSGTYKYTTRLGMEKQVFRLRPVWDLDELSEQVKNETASLERESAEARDAAIRSALTRTWTSSSFSGLGQFKKVFGIGGNYSVILIGPDESEIKVPLKDLSEEDQQWIAEYQKHSKP